MHTPSLDEINIIKHGIDELRLENKSDAKMHNLSGLFIFMACLVPVIAMLVTTIIESHYVPVTKLTINWRYCAFAGIAILVELFCLIYNAVDYKKTEKRIQKLNSNCLVVEANTRKCDILSSGVMVTSEPIADTNNIVIFHTDYKFAEQVHSDRKILVVATEDEHIYAMSQLPDGSVLAGRWAEIVNMSS